MNASRQELPKNQHQAAAAALRTSEQTGIGGPPLSDTYPGLTVNDAYAIQMININGRVDAGAVIVGHKVGLTAKAMQVLLGVDEPDFGHILDDMVHPSGGTLVIDGFLQPRVEPEIAFRLGRPLRGPNVTVADVLAATDAVCASLEIVDSRIADWKIALVDTIADNASSAGMVLGPDWVPIADAPDLPYVAVELFVNGDLVDTGLGSAVLGHPAAAVAWLANTLAPLGACLDAGQIILPGSCTSAPFIRPGDRVEARFSGLGTVDVEFTTERA
jgi:2-keto-4-pentenoate hydratase